MIRLYIQTFYKDNIGELGFQQAYMDYFRDHIQAPSNQYKLTDGDKKQFVSWYNDTPKVNELAPEKLIKLFLNQFHKGHETDQNYIAPFMELYKKQQGTTTQQGSSNTTDQANQAIETIKHLPPGHSKQGQLIAMIQHEKRQSKPTKDPNFEYGSGRKEYKKHDKKDGKKK